jgi:cysteinyl-tRNA synthetase
MLRLYNTLTRSKEAFAPIDPKNVRMYVCGPTVYDFAHIGNARPVIVFDVLFRLLRHLYGADHVTYVRNITDVDDKINARAGRDFPRLPLNEAIRKVTEKTANQFHEDVAALGCLEPTYEPRATEFVLPRPDGKADMVTLIQKLITRGHAYESQGEVLFDTTSMADYGQLSKRNLDEQQAGARVAVEAHKKHPADFVLWKQSAENEPGWDSPWGRGRPGWHIECSAMAEAYLGEVFDIHGGGLDLIFPHHENEIAQSRCAHGTDTMAKVWMHNGFLQVEGRKMSKSEGNFVTIHDVLREELPALVGLDHTGKHGAIRRSWNGLTARFSMLQTNYREPIDWTRQRLLEASEELYRWYEILRSAHFETSLRTHALQPVVDALSDDLNTWESITELRAAAKQGNVRELGEGMALLGLLNPDFVINGDILLFDRTAGVEQDEVERFVKERLAFIREKNWAEADRIRDELLQQGIQLKDGKDPATGERVTTWEVKR